jgi:hypothetical protein
MSPPRAGSGRKPLGRLVDALRRWLRPQRGAPPATVPGLGSGEETAVAAAMRPAAQERAATAEAEPGAPLAAEPERAVTADEPMPVTDAAAEAGADADAAPEAADARFDAARDRLRSTIKPPPDADAD